MKKLVLLAFSLSLLFAFGCQQSQPEPIQPQPTYTQQQYVKPAPKKTYRQYHQQPTSEQVVRAEDLM